MAHTSYAMFLSTYHSNEYLPGTFFNEIYNLNLGAS